MSNVDMSGAVECPVCFGTFSSSKINNHVEVCLSREEKCSTRRGDEILRTPETDNDNFKLLTENDNGCCKVQSNLEGDTGEKSRVLVTCLPNRKDHETLVNEYAKITAKKSNSANSVTKSITSVLGKRKYPEQSPPKGTQMKLTTHAKFSPDTTAVPTSSPALKGERDFSSTDQKEIVDVIRETPVCRQPLLGLCGTSPLLSRNKKPTKFADASKASTPLAERLRPKDFDRYFGQDEIVGQDSSLWALLHSGRVPSMILWGPPGSGKTSLVNIIANMCTNNPSKRFVKLSATTSGINDVKEAVKVAKNEAVMFRRETILFIDEIHRFNKLQQDFFLPHVEHGTITLIGATTENPSFQVNNALLSRCKVLVLKKHTLESLLKILEVAVHETDGIIIDREEDVEKFETGPYFLKGALETLANLSDGDARAALNGLEMVINWFNTKRTKSVIDQKQIALVLQRNPLLYDRNGEEHYNVISAFHKSIRGSDVNATLYWLARMLEGGEDPLYIARRMIRAASEDIGIADNSALANAVAAYQACHFIGMPECEINLAHIAVYLARAPKSIEIYKAYQAAKSTITNWKGPHPGVPLHLRNAPTKLMKDLGYGKDYKYNPEFTEPIEQDYLPPAVNGLDFFAAK